ncbi:VanZ family protein [Guptibacillus algicola]|uniref:VanZ family protein n=1 Tax=Guptibacillus algicola TaxID=225844 RepID=UPI001CD4E004|nr:VanZ family protein [Alkalihalobacillus algicola]MCA0986886.1 VanZ family protein [Alkalihalobacillus algicola]
MMFLQKWLWLLLALLMMTILFISSNTPYQNQDVKPLFREWVTITQEDLPQIEFTYDGALVTPSQPYNYVEFFLRKSAHVVSFGLLAFFWMMFFKGKYSKRVALLLGFALALLYALFDEFHQSLIPNRTGHLIDVFIPDTLGIVIASFAFLIMASISKKEKAEKSS